MIFDISIFEIQKYYLPVNENFRDKMTTCVWYPVAYNGKIFFQNSIRSKVNKYERLRNLSGKKISRS